MALREENYVFFRRIADRGNDKIMFDSQDRKIQETDSRDVIWDEIVGKEEHPEFYDGYKFLETDSEAFIRDENYGKEAYPGNCSVIYPSPPCFDEYRDEDWYSWFISGDRNLPGYKFRDVEALKTNVVVEVGSVEGQKNLDLWSSYGAMGIGAIGMGGGCESEGLVATGGDAPELEIPIFQPQSTEGLNFELHKISSLINMEFQIEIGCDFLIDDKKMSVALDKDVIYDNVASMLSSLHSKCRPIKHVEIISENMRYLVVEKNINHGGPQANDNNKNKLVDYGPLICSNDGQNIASSNPTKKIGRKQLEEPAQIQFWSVLSHLHFGYVPTQDLLDRRSNAPFDPGGTSLESGKTIYEVELFMRFVKIMITGNRVDVPFDPGGFGPKAKLEDEFFSKTGSMMQ